MQADKIVKPNVNDQARTIEWFWYSHAYLDAAKRIAHAYRDGQEDGSILGNDALLILPLVFNLRHSVELLLKFLLFTSNEPPSAILSHDIPAIFRRVRADFDALREEDVLFAADALSQEPEFIRRYIRASLAKIEAIATKYSEYRFCSGEGQGIEDPQNELFRYPSATVVAGPFNPEIHAPQLTAAEVLEDIEALNMLMMCHAALFFRGDDGSHFIEVLFKDQPS